MPSVVIANAVQVRLIWTFGTLTASNVLGGTVVGAAAINQALANSLGAAIKARLTSSGQVAHLVVGASLASVGVRDIRSANNPELIDTNAAVAGTGAGDGLPPQIALCVTLRTARAGRSFRGRCFLPYYPESDNAAGGVAIAAAQTAGGAFLTGVSTDFVNNGLSMAVLSRPRYALDGGLISAGFATPITAAVVRDLRWDTQRRRVT